MENLNFVNLIQAAITATSILGGALLWLTKSKEYRGVAVLLFLISFGSCINILEESGLTRDIYLISPIFIMLFGPATYLAIKLLVNKSLSKQHFWHLAPVIPVLFITSQVTIVIGIGTLWRLSYALLTVLLLLKYKKVMDEQRSDSDDFSLTWLVWILALTAVFNLIDLARLNMQHAISYDLNVLGQGVNNVIWLIVTMVIIVKLLTIKKIPQDASKTNTAADNAVNKNTKTDDYSSLYSELDSLITSNKWYLRPRLTLNNLSDLTGLQTRDISRAINVVTNKSFNEYINNYRVEFVCKRLIANKNKSLTDIAADAGFSSKASFNKVFKQVSGVTPSEYKAQNLL
ncbi:helix-turn-helix domain-containing protein [Thalassotalea crassostreae]|uniref:helix-turn-helix domain-containing protein n=1 Tax=Thalassotalea crassostreae TaxID=1763536 RepID=UPI000838C922|nr:helix-turn-helix transcriptional regulator [Thalassotalea crassostreae]